MNNVVGQFPDPTGPPLFVVGQDGRHYLVQPGSSRQQPSPLYNPFLMQQHHYQSQFQLLQHQQQQLQQHQQSMRLQHPIASSQQLQRLQIVEQPIIQQTRHQLISQQPPQQQQQSQLPPQTIQQLQAPTPPQQPQQQQQPQKIKTPHLNASKKDETNSNGHKPTKNQSIQAKLQNVKREKCITHYIDGQIIIETSRPLSEKKAKKKKELKQQQQQVQQQQQQNSQQPPQPQPQSQPKPLQQQTQIQPQPRPQPRPQPHSIPQPMPQPSPHILPQQYQQQQQQVHSRPQLPQQQARPQPISNEAPNKRPNSPASIRAEMPNWSVTDVVRFIEQHEDIKQYAEKFREDEVDGKALLLMIDRNLKLEVLTSMFRYGPAMKVEATLSKYKLND